MIIISGCVIVRNNKILMVKEAQEKCFGQWNFPAGHVNEGEMITEAGIREVLEETGCKVQLTGILPILTVNGAEDGETRIMVRFTAEIIEEDIKFDKNEILDVKWISIKQVKNMKKDELRTCEINLQFIKDIEENKIFPLGIFNTTKYIK